MSKRKALDESRKTDDVCQALERHPLCIGVRQNGTSHRVYTFPKGSIPVPVGHDKELARGTYNSILRAAALLGLLTLVMAVGLTACYFLLL